MVVGANPARQAEEAAARALAPTIRSAGEWVEASDTTGLKWERRQSGLSPTIARFSDHSRRFDSEERDYSAFSTFEAVRIFLPSFSSTVPVALVLTGASVLAEQMPLAPWYFLETAFGAR